VLFAVGATGLFVLLARATTPGHYEVLRLHVWVGWASLVFGGPALVVHLGTSRRRWTVAAAAALVVAGCLALFAALGLAAPEGTGRLEHLIGLWEDHRRGLRVPRVFWGPPIALAAILMSALVLLLASFAARLEQLQSARWWGLTLTLAFAWAAVSGAGLPLVPRDHVFTGLAVHSAVGIFALVLVAQHVLAVRLTRHGFSRVAVSGLAVLLFGGVGAAGIGLDRLEHRFPRLDRRRAPEMTSVRTPRTREERTLAMQPDSDWPRLNPAVRRDSMTCMAAGCHPEIGREWAGSPHRFSATNAFYRAAVGDLLRRGDREGAVFCANCHDPERVLTGQIATEYLADGTVPQDGTDGVSCLVCHGMVSVDSDPPGNGLFTIAAAPPHTADVARFREDVAMDPRRHDQVFGVDPFVLSPMPCRSCHRLQLGRDHGVLAEGGIVIQNQGLPESAPGFGEITCEECHLPRIQREFDQYTHRMPGINVDLAAYVPRNHPEDDALLAAYAAAAAEQAGLTPRIPIASPEWPPRAPEPTHFVDLDETIRVLSLRVVPTLGDDLRLDVTTRNLRVGHDFPSGPLDLQQVWLEVRVADADGKVLHHVGDLEDGAIAGDPPRLGGRELDANGEDIRHHRLFEIATVEKRSLILGGTAEDTVVVAVPEGVRFPLDVRARWLFRRAVPSFARWALGGDEFGTGSPLAAHELVTWQGAVQAPSVR
jgi:phosphatidylserine synthase